MGNMKSKIHDKDIKKIHDKNVKKIYLQKLYNKQCRIINNDAVTIKYIGYDEYNKKKYKNEPKYSYTYKGVPGGWYF
jgi:hypothetical protein|tara:strand:- start:313 stop:543 length:231 start_codon:yes stop_codon:yes gene_type:complete